MATNPMLKTEGDLLDQLRLDHLKVNALFDDFARASTDAEKLRVVQKIYVDLLPHAQAEEEIFYPALRDDADAEDDVEHAYDEHAAAKETIESILKGDPDDLGYDMKVKKLQKALQHHITEEETKLFQEARDAGLDLEALGRQVAARKAELKPLFEKRMRELSGV